jgi:S1-C subfamily serine protease
MMTCILVADALPQEQDDYPKRPKSSLGLIGEIGYVVEAVDKGKTAEQVGLRTGDIVLQVANKSFSSLAELKSLLQGENVTSIRILRREGKKYQGQVLQLPPATPFEKIGMDGFLGFIVQKVLPDSPGSNAGFQAKDVVLEVNGKPFTSIEEFRQLGMSEPGTKFTLKVQRRDETDTQRYHLSIKTAPLVLPQ